MGLRLSAAGGDGQAVDATHFRVANDRGIGEECLGKVDRICAPEDFAVDDEAWHAENAPRRSFLGIAAQLILDLGESRLNDAELATKAGEACGIVCMLAAHPDRLENSFDRFRPAAAG